MRHTTRESGWVPAGPCHLITVTPGCDVRADMILVLEEAASLPAVLWVQLAGMTPDVVINAPTEAE